MKASLVLVIMALVAVGCADDDPDDGASTTAEAAVVPTSAAGTRAEAPTTTAPASTTTSTAPSTTAPTIELAGRAFVSTAVTGFEVAPGVQIMLSFDGDRIAAAGGCNQLMSTWSVEGDVLVVAEIAATRMACEPATLMDQDTWLSSLLTSDPTVTLDGDTLTLTEGQSSITLAAAP